MADSDFNINNHSGNQARSNNGAVIFSMLKAIAARAAALSKDVDYSRALLPLGVETDLTTAIKKVLENPISQILIMKEGMDSSIVSFIKLIFKRSFEARRNIILRAFQTETGTKDLHFSIILSRTSRNRKGKVSNLHWLWNYSPKDIAKR